MLHADCEVREGGEEYYSHAQLDAIIENPFNLFDQL